MVDDQAHLERRHFNVETRAPPKPSREQYNRWVAARYVPTPYAGVITLLRATEPADVYASDQFGGWGNLAVGGVDTHDIPGDHISIVTADGLRWGPSSVCSLPGHVSALIDRQFQRSQLGADNWRLSVHRGGQDGIETRQSQPRDFQLLQRLGDWTRTSLGPQQSGGSAR